MYNQYTTVSISTSKFFKDDKIALVSCYMKNALVFSQSDARKFFHGYYYTQIERDISDQVTEEYTPTRQVATR